ncbi:MAG: hypothetical protein IKB01_05975 [Lachnospiraceae bacterium]|nr:hypothetical protein [Lachnospiraceae bacterium]
MKSTITIVTGFFYIGREKTAKADLARSTQQYFDYFEQWAKMRNKLVVYTEPEFVEQVYQIREKFGLREKTIVIPVENVFAIEQELFDKMQKVSDNQEFRNYRFYVNAMSNDAKYDYVMMMKYWCLQDAAKRNLIEDMAAWLDFGFNHGGEYFINPDEFDYLWEYDFSKKIHCFAFSDPQQVLGVKNMQLQRDCMMGAPIVLPKDLCDEFWALVKRAMESLLWIDCIDDDQQLVLMAIKQRPELFEVHYSDWFLPLKEYGGEHLTVKPKTARRLPIKMVIRNILMQLTGNTNEQLFIKRVQTFIKK